MDGSDGCYVGGEAKIVIDMKTTSISQPHSITEMFVNDTTVDIT